MQIVSKVLSAVVSYLLYYSSSLDTFVLSLPLGSEIPFILFRY